jgi:undecaprenyl-diphosphatase
MNYTLLGILIGTGVVLMFLERLGLPTTLKLQFKGDVKRETRWLAQYGQAVSALVASALVWQLDPVESRRGKVVIAILAASFGAAIIGMLIKKISGRVRPGHEGAGKFTGLSLRHANWCESFPSNHTASAIAMSVVLATIYPHAAATFWTLGIACATLRYILDAHWPSDVLGGAALGYATAFIVMQGLHLI